MPLNPGTRIGPYEVSAPLGAGGMGEVYRARDTKLDRSVAIKILPDSFSNTPERIARFEREAKTLAAMNHPNIASIYGFEDTDGVRALVMELVEGPTLADRIARGAIPIEEAVPIARQIVDALEAAHDQGIVHRDLKPANIKLRPDGTVKVLDFGLAKALEPLAGAGIDSTRSPTITSPVLMTGVGTLLGTAAYMSPEQARGKPVDRRADIWAFGCVLYEMLCGRRPFEGEDVSLTLSQILQREPELDALPADVPPRVRRTVQLCLRKALKERMPDMGAARLMLDGVFETATVPVAAESPVRLPAWRRALPFFLTALTAASLGSIAVWRLVPAGDAGPHGVVRFTLPAPATIAPRGAGVGRHVLALSPQGTHLVCWGGKGLQLRALDRLQENGPIRGTESAREPFFSPDGQWIAFYSEGQLRRVSATGGAPVALGEVHFPWGANWDFDGVIRYGQGADGIWQVSPNGGAPTQLITVGNGEAAHGPQLLPDGNWVLFTFRPASKDSWDDAQIVAQSLKSGERTVLIERGRDARYLRTGHLVYGLNGALLGVPFDARSRRVTGPAVPLVEGVMDADTRSGAIHFTVSNDGTLVYLLGASGERSLLNWVHRDGRREPLRTEALNYTSPRVSPDGTRIAVEVGQRESGIQICDTARNTLTSLTSGSVRGSYPLWTRDNRSIVFYSGANGGGLYLMAADGTGAMKRLTTSRANQIPYSWADGGRTLIFEQRFTDPFEYAGIYRLSLAGDSTPTPLVQTAADESEPAVSPDGRWLAYTLWEPGMPREEIYVRPFPQIEGGRWRISTEGGTSPLWSPDSRKLFFISQGRAMSVPIEAAQGFRAGTPTMMFDLPAYYKTKLRLGLGRQWDIAPDGERFLIINPGENVSGEGPQSQIVVVLNWFEDLKRLVPSK